MPKHTVKDHFSLIEEAVQRIQTDQAVLPKRSTPEHALSLTELAEQFGLSAFHFQRLFKNWAGISPQHFRHMLSRQRALERLREGETVLMAALEAGLSSPSQLHDLTVKLEAMTPGEIRQQGQNIVFTVGMSESPMGWLFSAHTERGLHRLEFASDTDWESWTAQLQRQWPKAEIQTAHTAAEALSKRLFDGPSKNPGPIELHLQATPFQLKVWEALIRLPSGYGISYGQLAKALGMPKAARAVGSAVANNPVAVLIPCHRVIQSTGVLGEYRWGMHRKALLTVREDLERHSPA
ncbi:MAG TPA: methylated-DNA--[protein]-cysteine S-methyltransferase [Limnobacter sp.]|uniref:methylated-DNA--[protein]-cysteine S-methyltransferase n=1 Tax=Limnobacter sp. TaxID=2003368 RepID=UPI002EDAFC22